jgi:hypothetical protein
MQRRKQRLHPSLKSSERMKYIKILKKLEPYENSKIIQLIICGDNVGGMWRERRGRPEKICPSRAVDK